MSGSSGSEAEISWSEEANRRLARVPGFLRRMVRRRAEALAVERGAAQVTGELMEELAMFRPGGGETRQDNAAPRREERPAPGGAPEAAPVLSMAWTAAARERLGESPSFFQSELVRISEAAAREGGHLEVNLALLDGLESREEFQRQLTWSAAAETALAAALEARPDIVRDFISPAMEEAAERIALAEKRRQVDARDVECAFDTRGAGVEWTPEALDRVQNAPEFVRGGIKKAAEEGARREGLAKIAPEDLTRFRNRAMMRAVKRMRGFGFRELNFDVFETARERVPRLRDNPQAEKRFAAIRNHVEGKGGLGVIDSDLIDRMKRYLRDGDDPES